MLHVQNLKYAPSHGRGRALTEIHFEVHPGEILGILGPKGSGKATLQNILIGMYRQYSGTVHFQGKELNDWSRDFFEVMGTLLPSTVTTHFSQLTAEDDLKYFASLYRGPKMPIADTLALANLKHAALTRIRDFSVGMLARLSLVRAMMHQPTLLFLYEPLAAIEPEYQNAMQDLIRSQKLPGRGVMVLSQDSNTVKALCDRIVSIEDGKSMSSFPKSHESRL